MKSDTEKQTIPKNLMKLIILI